MQDFIQYIRQTNDLPLDDTRKTTDETSDAKDKFSDDKRVGLNINKSSKKPPSEYFSSEYEGVELDREDPPEGNWVFPTLFAKNNSGKLIAWRIGFNVRLKALIWCFGTHLGDKTQVFYKEIKTNNLHNSIVTKAWQDAKAKINNKVHGGYNEVIDDASRMCVGDSGFPLPMLANTYKPPHFDVEKNKHKSGNIKRFPVILQAKFDGVRNLARLSEDDEGGVEMMSRELRKRDFFRGMRKEIKSYLSLFPEDTVLDGEFFTTDKAFQMITSIVSSKKNPHPDEEKIRFYIFDVFNTSEQWTSDYRMKLMSDNFEKYIDMGGSNDFFLLVNTHEVNTHEEIIENSKSFINQGFEGVMIRHLALGETSGANWKKSLYCHTRTDNLLKLKDFQEKEVEIIGVKSAGGKDTGSAIFIYLDNDTGLKGTVRPAATLEDRRIWYQHPELVIGKNYTVRYQNKTDDGALRFPTGKGFR